MPRKTATVSTLPVTHKAKPLSESRTWKGSQSWHDERLFDLNGWRVRTVIKRDAYDLQSYARVDVLDGLKWEKLHSLDISFWPIEARVSYVSPANSKNFDGLVSMLLVETSKILGA